jgi:O-antigen/teichoic acid export membrane protein
VNTNETVSQTEVVDVKHPSRSKISPFIFDVLLTALTSIFTGISMLVVSRLLAHGLGAEGFGIYSIARRIFFALSPCATLAMNMAIVRYVAVAENQQRKFEVFLAGLILSVAPCLLLIILCWPVRDLLGQLMFHGTGYEAVVTGMLFMLFGNAIYTTLYSFYRGSGSMMKANFWQLVVIAIGPMIVCGLLARQGKVEPILLAMGALYMVALLPVVTLVVCNWPREGIYSRLRPHFKILFNYGIGRATGGLILASIFACGPLLAPYLGTLKDAGYLAAGQAVFSLSESGVVAFGLVVLPKAAQLATSGQQDFLRQRIGDIISLILHLGLFISLQLVIWSDLIVEVWLGPEYRAAAPIMRVLLVAITPYLTYVMLRSIVDAVEERSINTWNLLLALIVNVIVSLILGRSQLGMLGIAIGTAVSFSVLGLVTLFYLHKAGWIEKVHALWGVCLGLNALATLISLVVCHQLFISPHLLATQQLIIAFVLMGVLFLCYCFGLWKMKATWIEQILIRLVRPSNVRSGGSTV